MTLRIEKPGLRTLLVDAGRPSSRSLGVPIGGAADRFALAIANALVGNAPEAPALEINVQGPTLVAECPLACVVWGAPFSLVCAARPSLRAGATFTLEAGDVLEIGVAAQGMRGYFCVAGGFDNRPVLGSKSGLSPLASGAEVLCTASRINSRFVRHAFQWNQEPRLLRVLPGAQRDQFDFADFCAQKYEITKAANRMGLRLRGPALPVSKTELLSEPVCPGTVQVTKDGQCIILGIDGQTIGGYPKIAQVISADVDKLAQLRPGERVHFQEVTLETARELFLHKAAELHEWVTRLQVSAT
jgi:antagonist of KipI